MRDHNWIEVLRRLTAKQIARMPKRHRLRTSRCPSLALLADDPADWSAAERKHIESCPYCSRVLRMLTTRAANEVGDILRFRRPLILPEPSSFAAAGAPLDISGKVPGWATDWRLKQDGEAITLQLRTHEAVSGQEIDCELHGAKGSKPATARLVFRAEEFGWVVAHANWPIEELHQRLHGECRALRLGKLESPRDRGS